MKKVIGLTLLGFLGYNTFHNKSVKSNELWSVFEDNTKAHIYKLFNSNGI